MTRAFPTFFMQIERNLRSTIAFVRDQEKFLLRLAFEVDPKSFQSAGSGLPPAPSIGRVASPDFNTDAAKHIGIEREHAHKYSDAERASAQDSPGGFRFQMRLPESDCK